MNAQIENNNILKHNNINLINFETNNNTPI